MRYLNTNNFNQFRLPILLGAIVVCLSVCFAPNLSIGQTANEEIEFPYQALILNEGATIHSGPGSVHYSTRKMKQGDAVEVYRHDPGGWNAIRPVSGSFSLVPESVVKVVSQGIGLITEDGTQAWVGTEYGPVSKPLWQVKLKRGETVELLGQISWPHADGHSTTWYQIAPPAGEFRWVRMSDIRLPLGHSIKKNFDTAGSFGASSFGGGSFGARSFGGIVSNQVAPTTTPSRFNVPATRPATPYKTVSINEGWRQATKPIAKPSSSNRLSGGYNNSARQLSSFESALAGMGESIPNRPSRGATPLAANVGSSIRIADANLGSPNLARGLSSARTEFGNAQLGANLDSLKLDDLEFKLTQELLNHPPQWQLETLELAAQSLYQRTSDASERARLTNYLQKITNCKTVRAGYNNTNNTTYTSAKSGRLGASGLSANGLGSNGVAASGLGSNLRGANGFGSSGLGSSGLGSSGLGSSGLGANGFGASGLGVGRRGVGNSNQPVGSGTRSYSPGAQYDATGWLNEMVRQGGQSSSTFVLQDQTGKITHLVATAAGVDLRPFIKKRVGINGQLGFHTTLNRRHVTAMRIAELR